MPLTGEAVGIVLRTARPAAGLTQAELAAKLGKPQSWVAKVEAGGRRLDLVEFVDVAEALELDPVGFLAVVLDAAGAARPAA